MTAANPPAPTSIIAPVPVSAPTGPSPVAVLSATLVAVGGLLVLLRLAARRLAPAG
jgi:hypothetical protein